MIEAPKTKDPARLLLACLSFTQDETTKAIQKQASLEEWEASVNYAKFHGVAQILYKQIKSKKITQEIPQEIESTLRTIYLRSIQESLRTSKQSENILDTFDKSGIPLTPLKGLFLAEKVYQNIALRPMDDIDLLVPREQLTTSLDQLYSLGYHLSYPVDLKNDLTHLHSLPLRNDSTKHSVDLHWNLFPPEVPVKVDIASIWNHTHPDTIFSARVLSMSCEELILYLCVHFIYMHRYLSRLFHVYDIAMVLLIFQEQIDWRRLIQLANEWGVVKATFLSLTLADQLLDAPVPQKVFHELLPDDYQPNYLENVKDQLLQNSEFSAYLVEFWMPSSLTGRIKIFFKRVFFPPHVLRQSYPHLASGIGMPLAYLLRLISVIRRQVPIFLKLLQQDPDTLSAARHTQTMEKLRQWLDSP